MRAKTLKGKALLFLITLLAYVPVQAQQSGLHLIRTFHIQSPGGWDYLALNPATGNLYVSHSSRVNVLSGGGDSITTIENTAGVHGIAFAPSFGKGFISNGKLNTVSVFDIKTNMVLASISVGQNPDAIMYEPFSKTIIEGNGKDHSLSIIDPATEEVIKTVELSGKPEAGVSNGKGRYYVNIEDKNSIDVLDTKTWKVIANWPLQKGEGPSGLAIDNSTHRLFAGCENKMLVVMDAGSGKVIANVPTGEGCDGVAYDPILKYIYSSNGEGTLSIIRQQTADQYSLLENLPTKRGARTLTVDLQTHLIYLPTAEFSTIASGKQTARPQMIPGTFQVLVFGQ